MRISSRQHALGASTRPRHRLLDYKVTCEGARSRVLSTSRHVHRPHAMRVGSRQRRGLLQGHVRRRSTSANDLAWCYGHVTFIIPCNACVLTSTYLGVLASPSTTRLKVTCEAQCQISRVVDIALRPSSSCNACVPRQHAIVCPRVNATVYYKGHMRR
jgi:hypothetical protein